MDRLHVLGHQFTFAGGRRFSGRTVLHFGDLLGDRNDADLAEVVIKRHNKNAVTFLTKSGYKTKNGSSAQEVYYWRGAGII